MRWRPTLLKAPSRALAILLVLVGLGTDLYAKRKDDKLVLSNGDVVVGEVKKLDKGQLYFKTGWVLDTFQADWAKVQTLESQDAYHVSVKDGRILTGTIARDANGRFTIQVGGAPLVFDWTEVVGILPMERSIWAQLTGQINSGFSYTGGGDDNQTQFSGSGAIGYVAERASYNLNASSTLSRQSEASTTRNTAQFTNTFTFVPKWFALGLLDLLNSEQQDLDLRTTAGGAIGRWLIHSDKTGLNAFGGMVYTHEQYAATSTSASTNNLEGLAGLAFELYRFDKTDVRSNFIVYPSITTPGRFRLSLAPQFDLQVARNLYWNFTLYENYDSQPPVNAHKNDFGVTNSIGWKF